VYNERQQIWKANRGDKKPLQYLISKLEEHNYTYFSRTQSESTAIEDIFWAHPTSVKLFNNFQTVLVMDSTYKTNMYKMPMFEVVGVTSTDLTYSVGFGFVTHEKEENFVWVLKMLRKLLTSKMNMPKVIVTDKDEVAKIEGRVRYSAFKKTIKVMITPTDSLDDLKAQFNTYFEHFGENQYTRHLFGQMHA